MYLKSYFKMCNMFVLLILLMMGTGGGGGRKIGGISIGEEAERGIIPIPIENNILPSEKERKRKRKTTRMDLPMRPDIRPSEQDIATVFTNIPTEAPFTLPAMDLESHVESIPVHSSEGENSRVKALTEANT
jgi:hypothetical protein